jgi:hypothetical protein
MTLRLWLWLSAYTDVSVLTNLLLMFIEYNYVDLFNGNYYYIKLFKGNVGSIGNVSSREMNSREYMS